MKRYLCVFVMIISILLTGCTDVLFTTAEYRSYRNFADRYQAGIGKQDVMASLGEPDSCSDGQERYRKFSFDDRAEYTQKLLDSSSTSWVYECYETHDPANPYRLVIRFDSEGKSTEIEWYLVPGG